MGDRHSKALGDRGAVSAYWIVALVLIHLLGSGAIVAVMVQREREQFDHAYVEALGHRLAGLAAGTAGSTDRDHLERAFQDLNHANAFRTVRGVAFDGTIVASTAAQEVGTRHWRADHLTENWPLGLALEWSHRGEPDLEQVTLTCPVGAEILVEGVLMQRQQRSSPLSGWALMASAVSTLALLVVCVQVYRRYRGLDRIGVGLVRHQAELATELSALRVTAEGDAVGTAWNQMIALFEDLQRSADRKQVVDELQGLSSSGPASDFLEAAEVIPEGVLYVVRGSCVRFTNAMARRYLDLPTEVMARFEANQEVPLGDLAHSDASAQIVEAVTAACTLAGFESRTVRLERGGGEVLRVRILPVVGRKQADALIMISDMTQLARAEKAREALFTQITHELRTPLTNIRAYTETLAEVDDPETHKECYNVIDKEARRLSRLVEEMLSQSQMGLGEIQIRRNDVDIKTVLEEAVRDLRATAEAKDITITARLPSKMPRMQADRDKVAVVINNILGNALKYTPAGGNVAVSAETVDDHVHVRVRDSGIGIAPEHHERIFEEMFRVDSADVQRQIGSGIGLFTAREIARRHGGDIRVTSVLGEGSEFVIDLPVVARAISVGRNG